ncbi:hypothetical protein DFH27DRAFT_582182 [Peziza echinospora]|nr:hypothetical protein DFH27DRAFT_582182 [Peziza echinospora]
MEENVSEPSVATSESSSLSYNEWDSALISLRHYTLDECAVLILEMMGYESHPGYPPDKAGNRLLVFPPIAAKDFLHKYLRGGHGTKQQTIQRAKRIAIHLGLCQQGKDNTDPESLNTDNAQEQLEPLFHLLGHPQGTCRHETVFYDYTIQDIEDLLEYITTVGVKAAAAEFKWDGEQAMLEKGFEVLVKVMTYMIAPFRGPNPQVAVDEDELFGPQVTKYWRRQKSGVWVMDLAREWGLGYKSMMINAFLVQYQAEMAKEDWQRQSSPVDSQSSA